MKGRSYLYDALLVFTFAITARLWLIHAYPAIFGGDPVLRLANSDRILLAYQLPLLQAGIYGTSQLFEGALPVRYLMAVIGAVASVACYALATDLMPRLAALATAMIFASIHSSLSFRSFRTRGAHARSPDVRLSLFFNGRNIAASLALGLACLTRYEAWAACPVLAAIT